MKYKELYDVRYFREFLIAHQFTEIISSKIVGGGTEGGTNLFAIRYFDQVAYLAHQSPQFYKEHGVTGGLAIGLERLTAQVLGLSNVRDATLYPRDRYRLTP